MGSGASAGADTAPDAEDIGGPTRIHSLTVGPGCEAIPLFAKVDLMCCPFDDEGDKAKRDPAVPPQTREQLMAAPVFKSVASQTLEIQRIGTLPQPRSSSANSSSSGIGSSSSSGSNSMSTNNRPSSANRTPRMLLAGDSIHQYYPIRFDRSHAVDLDCMVHCGVSAIRYPKISLSLLPTLATRKAAAHQPTPRYARPAVLPFPTHYCLPLSAPSHQSI